MNNKAPNCKYCKNPADFMDYREVDTVTSKIPSCRVCSNLSNQFHYRLNGEEKVKELVKQLDWFHNFADSVKSGSNYEQAKNFADDKEIEKYGETPSE